MLAYRDVQRAVRDQRWKLIRYPQVNVTQLFDLAHDPDERMNLADQPEYASRVAALTEELQRWQRVLGDSAPLVVDHPQPAAWDPSQRPATAPGKAGSKGSKKAGAKAAAP
jgi:arylsulfatase A-like enzyme